MSKNVIILGAGGHAKVIADIIEKSGDKIIGFLDNKDELQNNIIYNNKKVIGKIDRETTEKYRNEYYFIIGIGCNKIRKDIANKYNLNWYTAIHPNAIIANEVQINEGSVIMAGAIINVSTKIGKHCIINTKSSIDHDNLLEDFVHISPGATLAGTVHIKEGTWIGAGATIINNIIVEKNNIIGAGSLVIKNITDSNGVYVGVPIRKIK